MKYSYDTLKDISTRSNLVSLLGRSAEYLQQEDMLMCEVIKAQKYLKDWSSQRDHLYNTHAFNQSSSKSNSDKSMMKKRRPGALKGTKRDKDDGLLIFSKKY